MRIFMIFGLAVGAMILKAYLTDMMKEHYYNKIEEDRKQHILEMKL